MATATSSWERSNRGGGANRYWRWFYVVLGVVVTAVVAFNILRPITVLPRITLAPGYIFTNQDGERVTSEDFRGQLTLYSFTYANCDGTCPMTGAQLTALHDRLEQIVPPGVPFSLVTISLDPERDTPETLRAFAADLPTGPAGQVSWDIVTGDPMKTKFVVGGGFSLYYAAEEETDAVSFDPRFVLVDGWGIIRAEYLTAAPDPAILERDINLVLEEARNSEGATRVAYEAAHLFLCYPR